MKSLERVRFKHKLIILLIIPLAGLFYFSTAGLLERSGQMQEMSSLQSVSTLSVHLSELVHETQKERGATAGYIGSDGTEFEAALLEQRKSTDNKRDELRRFLDAFEDSMLSKEIDAQLGLGLSSLEEIEERRGAIDSLSVSADKAIAYYTGMNTAFLNTIAELAQLSNEGEIVRRASAYVNFLFGKERAGIERAVLSNTFAADGFAEGMYRKFGSLVTAQEVYLDVFHSFATAEQRSYFQQKMDSEVVEEVEAMEERAFDRAGLGNFGVDSTYWFDRMTEKINLLKDVEDKLSSDLVETSEMFYERARDQLILFVLITTVILLVTAVVAFVIARGILKQLGGEPAEMERIAEEVAKGDLYIKLEDEGQTRGKESTGVYRSLIGMLDSLKMKADVLQSIADKDLTVEVQKASDRDVFGESLITMKNSLNEILLQVFSAVDQVNNGADQISQASQSLSQGATEQASSLEEISSSANQISGQSKQNAENATEANGLAKKATEDAENGNAQMRELTEVMEQVNASSDEIHKVVKVIDDIAFQINLLALNANVEAARAGKYGKGFAVVADEVRNLAVKSTDSVKETTKMVDETVNNIRQGTAATQATARQLTAIVEGSGKVANFLEEIAQASREQAQAIEQITEGLDQIDQATQASTASAEESASASEELAGQAQQLRSMVAQFKLDQRETAWEN